MDSRQRCVSDVAVKASKWHCYQRDRHLWRHDIYRKSPNSTTIKQIGFCDVTISTVNLQMIALVIVICEIRIFLIVTPPVAKYEASSWHIHTTSSLQLRHNDHDGVLNHKPHGCLLNRSFGHRSTKTSKLCVTGLCAGNSPGPVNSPHKWPVTRKMFPFDDVIMLAPVSIWIPSFQVWDSHYNDNTVVRPSYFHHGNSYTGQTTSSFWNGTLGFYPSGVWVIKHISSVLNFPKSSAIFSIAYS